MRSRVSSLKLRYGRDAIVERLTFGHAEGTAGHHFEYDGAADHKEAPKDVGEEQDEAIWLPQHSVAKVVVFYNKKVFKNLILG